MTLPSANRGNVYTLDTNAIIYFLKGDETAVKRLEKIFAKNVPIYISTLTEVELFGFPDLAPKEEEQIEALLRTLAIIPVDSRIARIAGEIRSRYRVKISDSVIAATATFTGTTLLTRNIHDFKPIPELTVLSI